MGLMDLFNKRTDSEYLNDMTYIQEVKRYSGLFQQYDILLAAGGYGWDYMKSSADYMASADLLDVQQVTMQSVSGAEENNITKAYKSIGTCMGLPENGVLSMAGISKVLNAPVKVVWFNQTRMLRVFSTIDDEVLIRKYTETLIRRTFNTSDAMKLGKPLDSANK